MKQEGETERERANNINEYIYVQLLIYRGRYGKQMRIWERQGS